MQKEPLPSIEYIYSKWTYFPEGQQFAKNVFFIGLMKYSNLLRLNWWVLLNVSLIITIKRTKDLNYFSLCALNLFNTQVSQFELNYWNKWTFPRHSNVLRCTCTCRYSLLKIKFSFLEFMVPRMFNIHGNVPFHRMSFRLSKCSSH